MTNVINVTTPDGQTHRHVSSLQNGQVKARTNPDGSITVVGIHSSPEVRAWGGDVARPARHEETELGTYPAGSNLRLIG